MPDNVDMHTYAKFDQNIPCGSRVLSIFANRLTHTIVIVHICGSCNLKFSPFSWQIFCMLHSSLIGPRREKTCLRGFRQSEIQTSLLSYRDNLEN